MSSLRRTSASICIATLYLGAGPMAGAATAVPLFSSEDPLEVTIRAPFKEIMRERPSEEDLPGQLTYRNADGSDVTLDIDIRTRGNYRRQRDICPFAPLRLSFGKKDTKDTVFAGSRKLKLVTHCRNGALGYTQALLREHLAYRILNRMTDESFRVRLLHITYEDSEAGKPFEINYGFLIEHRDQLADRIGLEVNKAESASIEALAAEHTNLGSLFQYLIGNTDFSPIMGIAGEMCCHNYVLFGSEPGNMRSIPYDFDMSGIVDADYATPNPRFGLHSVRERLYRGRCDNNAVLEQSIAAFQSKRDEIYALVTEPEWFSNASRRKTIRFLNGFYATIDNPKQVTTKLVNRCLK
ncbi:MAG TPA: hypothetical protein VIS31_13435 [Woeseiaceae bacterium]